MLAMPKVIPAGGAWGKIDSGLRRNDDTGVGMVGRDAGIGGIGGEVDSGWRIKAAGMPSIINGGTLAGRKAEMAQGGLPV